MSETTKRAIPTDLMDTSTHWCERVDATHLIARPVPYHVARANLRAAEGSVVDFTPTRSGSIGTASEAQTSAEIGSACTGRKMALVKWAIIATQAVVAFLLISDVGPVFGLLIWGYGFATGVLLAKFWVVPFFESHRSGTFRAFGGEGV